MLKLPPPIWALLLLTSLYFVSALPVFAGLPEWRDKPAGVVIMLLGFLFPFTAITHFLAVGTQIMPTSEVNNRLVVSGAYRLTRNPMYLGLVIVCLGAALWFGRPLMFLAPALLFAIANWIFIPYEEAKMRRQFGDEFEAYAKRVRRWI
jgi:protein-S-isoprenylcysteine O-methyltransferase Ste14